MKPKLYFDWSGTKGLHVIDDDAKNVGDKDEVMQYAEFENLFNDLSEPTILIGEATFESFRKDRRNKIIRYAKERSHEMLVTPTRATRRRAEKLGIKDKTDFHDPYIIRDLANDGKTHLRIPTDKIDGRIVQIREENCEKLMRMRHFYIRVENKRNKISLKDYFAQLIIKQLPDFKDLPKITRLIIGNGDGRNYNLTSVAAVGVVTPQVKSGKELKKVCGLFHHGYPSQIRSDLMLHRWWGRFKPSIFNEKTGKWKPAGKLHGQATLTDFTREHIHLFHLIKNIGHEMLNSINNEIEIILEAEKKVEIKKEDVKPIKHKRVPRAAEKAMNGFFGTPYL
jgi:hypothetical protein